MELPKPFPLQRKEEIKKKSKLIQQLSSNLKIPLEQLIQFSDIALRRIQRKESELASDYLVEIKWISEELLIYIHDLLELCELKSGQKEFSLEELDIVYYLGQLARQFQAIAESRKISLSINSEIRQSCVMADYSKLEKVLNILLRHSFRQIQEAGSESHANIDIHLCKKAHFIHICISDNAKKTLQNSENLLFQFEEESQEDSLNDFSLSICKELMLGQNGDIEIESKPSGGNQFCLKLPISRSLLD